MNDDQTQRYYPPNTDLSFDPVSPEEERDLFQRARKGDTEARTKIIENHLLFAASEARRMVRGRLPDNDVVSAANLALMTALDRFDYTLGNRFTSYLRPFIKGAVSALWKQSVPTGDSEANITLAVEPQHAEEDYKAFLHDALTKCRSVLTAKESKLLTLVYDKGLSFAEVARKQKVSREWIRLSHNSALEKLRKEMKKLGISSSQ